MSVQVEAQPAYRVRGPAAVTGDRRRFAYLATTLAVTDWRLRFFGSLLGYVWTLLRPLLLFGILYAVFSKVVHVGKGVHYYPLLLLLGIVLHTYFAEVTSGAVTSVVDRELLVRKISFPRMVIPLSVSLSGSFNLLLNFVPVAIFVAIAGVHPRWTWLLVPLPLIVLVVVATGVAMIVSALYVPFRDVRPIWDVVIQALFYVTPVLYPIEKVSLNHPAVAHIMMGNPLAAIIQETRHLVLGSATPSAAVAIGGAEYLAIPAAIVIGLALLGYWVFDRMAPHVAEQL